MLLWLALALSGERQRYFDCIVLELNKSLHLNKFHKTLASLMYFLFQMQDPISYSNYARPICIPPNYRRVVPVNNMCYTAGWGETRGWYNLGL